MFSIIPLAWHPRRLHSRWRLAAAILAAAAILSCVAAMNRSPLPFPDSRAYWLGGRTAIQMASSIAERLLSHSGFAKPVMASGTDASRQIRDTVKSAAGVRSVFYSLFAYGIGTVLSPWGVVLLQALAIAGSVFLLARAVAPTFGLADYLIVVAGLCLLTSAPWTAAELLPDVFTGVVIAIGTVLFLRGDSLSWIGYISLACLLTFAISTHASHFPLVLALWAVSLVIVVFAGQSRRQVMALAGRLGAPIAAAVAATLLVSLVGFGQLSLTPQSPPFLLARSLQDGPARLLLQETCPASGYVMCGELSAIPKDNKDFISKFIWEPNSIYMSASPEKREQIRREEMRLVIAAAIRHPWQQAKASLTNFLSQATDFNAHEFHLGGTISVRGGTYTSSPGTTIGPVLNALTDIEYVAVLAAIIILAYSWFITPGQSLHWRCAIVLCTTGVLANAAICGVLSEPSPRYQARAVWLLVALALIYVVGRLHARSAAKSSALMPIAQSHCGD